MKRIYQRFVLLLAVLAALVFVTNSYQAQTYTPSSNELLIHFLDVGQGDATLIAVPVNRQILIDGGPGNAVIEELGEVMPLTDRSIDLVIVTHNDADHLSGVVEVLKRYEIGELWLTGAVHSSRLYQEFVALVNSKKLKTRFVKSGDIYELGRLHATVLWPLDSYIALTPKNQNEASIVTQWQFGEKKFLITGDITEIQELQLLEGGYLSKVDVLKVAHHGSKTSSSFDFLSAVLPKLAVISSGRNNPYNHPHPSVVSRLSELQIPILRTDTVGRVTLSSDGSVINYKTEFGSK